MAKNTITVNFGGEGGSSTARTSPTAPSGGAQGTSGKTSLSSSAQSLLKVGTLGVAMATTLISSEIAYQNSTINARTGNLQDQMAYDNEMAIAKMGAAAIGSQLVLGKMIGGATASILGGLALGSVITLGAVAVPAYAIHSELRSNRLSNANDLISTQYARDLNNYNNGSGRRG